MFLYLDQPHQLFVIGSKRTLAAGVAADVTEIARSSISLSSHNLLIFRTHSSCGREIVSSNNVCSNNTLKCLVRDFIGSVCTLSLFKCKRILGSHDPIRHINRSTK